MNDIVMEFNDETITFDIEQYNQLVAIEKKNFLKVLIRLKNLEGDKYDEYYQEQFKGSTYLYNQKVTSKNTLILDLNDFSKIIINLSFHKNSIIRKLYIADMLENISEDRVTSIMFELLKEYDYIDEISVTEKELGIEKMFDTLFNGHISTTVDPLSNTELLSGLVIKYLNKFEIKNAIIIADSSLNFFDLKPLIDDERIIIFDTNIQFNKNTNNIILFDNNVENYQINNIIEKIEFNWPTGINEASVRSLLQVYWHIILNETLTDIDMPSDNLLCLYLIIHKLFSLDIKLKKSEKWRITDEKISQYIRDNLVEYM